MAARLSGKALFSGLASLTSGVVSSFTLLASRILGFTYTGGGGSSYYTTRVGSNTTANVIFPYGNYTTGAKPAYFADGAWNKIEGFPSGYRTEKVVEQDNKMWAFVEDSTTHLARFFRSSEDFMTWQILTTGDSYFQSTGIDFNVPGARGIFKFGGFKNTFGFTYRDTIGDVKLLYSLPQYGLGDSWTSLSIATSSEFTSENLSPLWDSSSQKVIIIGNRFMNRNDIFSLPISVSDFSGDYLTNNVVSYGEFGATNPDPDYLYGFKAINSYISNNRLYVFGASTGQGNVNDYYALMYTSLTSLYAGTPSFTYVKLKQDNNENIFPNNIEKQNIFFVNNNIYFAIPSGTQTGAYTAYERGPIVLHKYDLDGNYITQSTIADISYDVQSYAVAVLPSGANGTEILLTTNQFNWVNYNFNLAAYFVDFTGFQGDVLTKPWTPISLNGSGLEYGNGISDAFYKNVNTLREVQVAIGNQGEQGAEVLAPIEVYVTPAGKTTTLSNVAVKNTSSYSITVDLEILSPSQEFTFINSVLWDYPIQPGQTINLGDGSFPGFDFKKVMQAGYRLVVLPSTVDVVEVKAYGTEV